MNRLIIIGAGGHGKVVLDMAINLGYKEIAFVDDKDSIDCLDYKVIGNVSKINDLNDGKTDFVIAIGNNFIRKRISETYAVNYVSLIHPTALIGIGVEIGKGTVVLPRSIINAFSKIGNYSIINTGAIVEHDNVIGDFVHISPRVTLGGTVHIGECCHIGIGATVKNNITICPNSVVGAGGVVVQDIVEQGVYIGVPTQLLKREN